MVVNEYTTIQISKSNRERLDNFKLSERESYNSLLNELIRFGEENEFKSNRIKNLTKKLEVSKLGNNKIKQRAITASTD